MNSINMSAQFAQIDSEIAQAQEYLKKLRQLKRLQAAIAKLESETSVPIPAVAESIVTNNDADPWDEPEQIEAPVEPAEPDRLPRLHLVPEPQPMNKDSLRKACQANGIKWRNAKGKNKHLSVEEMKKALAA